MLMRQAKLAAGLVWMEELAPLWVGLSSFMLRHNHFHIALNLLDLGM